MLTNNDSFSNALKFILLMEGGYVDHKNDLGGATNKGITQGVYDSFRLSRQQKKQSVKHITDTEVATIYKDRYWLPLGCAALPYKLALVVFDIGVNMGIAKPFEYFNEFGITKQKSWNSRAANDLKYYLSKHSEDELIKIILERRKTTYRRYALKPGQDVFLQGWLNRVEHLEVALGIAKGGAA